jgi:hypothetical protein
MAYGTAELLAWMVNDKAIEPHVPVWGTTHRAEDVLPNSDFTWHAEADEYRCPQGRALRSNWRAFKKPAHSHHQGRNDHISIEPNRLRDLPPKAPLLPKHSDS